METGESSQKQNQGRKLTEEETQEIVSDLKEILLKEVRVTGGSEEAPNLRNLSYKQQAAFLAKLIRLAEDPEVGRLFLLLLAP